MIVQNNKVISNYYRNEGLRWVHPIPIHRTARRSDWQKRPLERPTERAFLPFAPAVQQPRSAARSPRPGRLGLSLQDVGIPGPKEGEPSFHRSPRERRGAWTGTRVPV